MSDVIQAFLPVFWEENRQECLYHVHLRYCCDPLAISDDNGVTEF